MSLWVDIKYANLLGNYLEQYKKLDNYLFNFRCPICGDSKKSKYKSRGYIYKLKDCLNVKCHNCGYSSTLNNFIKIVDNNLFNEYLLDTLVENKPIVIDRLEQILSKPIIIKDQLLLGLNRVDTLPVTHPAISYLIKRKIPRNYWKQLFYTDKFKDYISKIDVTITDLSNDYPRLIIPYYNSKNECFGISARAFGKELPKYYNMKFDENEELIYGLNTVDINKRIYCVEGPIDSLFLPNCIATSGTSFNKPLLTQLKHNLVIIPDNEPRSPILVKLINNIIGLGFNISLFPDNFQYKDINDAIIGGMLVEDIINIIDSNIVSGIEAKLRFTHWKKC